MRADAGFGTLNHLFFHAAERAAHPALLTEIRNGRAVRYSTAEFRDASLGLAAFFLKNGLAPESRVAVLAESRPEWHIADFGILLAGLISVPVYTSFSPDQIRHVLEHSGAAALLLSTRDLWEKVQPILGALPDLRLLVAMERWPDMPVGVVVLPEIAIQSQPDSAALRAAALAADPAQTATIVYTSGTTGVPKGVMLSHGNIVFDLQKGLDRLEFKSAEQALTVLPLAHVFERLLGYGYFQLGIPIAYGNPHNLAELLPAHRPVVMGAVPRILERIRENVFDQISRLPNPRRQAAEWLLQRGVKHAFRGLLKKSPPPFPNQAPCALADLLVFRRLRAKLGGRLQYVICGGARLEPIVEEFFHAAGIHVLQGYGLTETSPVVSLTPLHRAKPGTVGKPLSGVELRFAEDGELVVRGGNVMVGYYREPALTAEAIRDGWLHTGDLGALDSDGYLVITGRKKEILVTSGGKKVNPSAIESALLRSPCIRSALILGDGRKFVAALIVPDRDRLIARAGVPATACQSFEELRRHPAVTKALAEEIDNCLSSFAEWEKVKQFSLLEEHVLEDPELFTPTQKLRRSALERKYRRRIEEIYSCAPGGAPAGSA